MSQPNPHRGVCCTCGTVYRPGVLPASHGYCLPCAIDARAQMEAEWAALQDRAREGVRVQLAGCLR